MSQATAGLGFATIALVATAGAVIWGGKAKKWDLRYICASCILIESIGIAFIGPSGWMGEPGELWLMFVGLILLGVGASGI